MATPNRFVAAEERLLEQWEEQRIFQRTLEQRADASTFTFYDGPPFANGLPHYGHMLTSVIKDSVTRYWTMRGYKVARTFGWDCHGLPVENEVEKLLKIKSKAEIEHLLATPDESIAEFCRQCRASVFTYQTEWRAFLRRIGRWADHTNEYATLDNHYIASVWWAFGELHRKGLVYQDYRVSPYCPRCGTPLSNFEVNQGYQTASDPAIYIKFRAMGEPDGKVIFAKPTYFTAWTTTPWTLPGNVALAVHPDIDYVAVELPEEILWLARERFEALQSQPAFAEAMAGGKIVATVAGRALVGSRYEPLFAIPTLQSEASHQLYPADFVTTTDGTGIVHTAVMYGEDDFALGKKYDLPQHHTVNGEGKFTADVRQWQGMFVKDADPLIIADLEQRGLLVGAPEQAEHEYPFCYRCESPLLYYALSSWFVKVTAIRDELVYANSRQALTDANGTVHEGIHWVPEHVREGRFGKWLEGARDWAISRSRYWGAPIPIWRCERCAEVRMVSDLEPIAQLAEGRNIFFGLRHGEAENNVAEIMASEREGSRYGLTERGRQTTAAAAAELAERLVSLHRGSGEILIYTSPIRRAVETAVIVQRALNLGDEQVIEDSRLRELDCGLFDGQSYLAYEQARAEGRVTGAESPRSIERRMREAITEYNSRHTGKVIIIISHGDPLWHLKESLGGNATRYSHRVEAGKNVAIDPSYPAKAQMLEMAVPWLDLHRPYIDEVTFKCKCGGTMRRIPDVFDCWFESGSMPYAQYGVASRPAADLLVNEQLLPADFIAEGLDQTRGWFYTLHVLSVALFGTPAYKNVIVNGFILAGDGKKLSKRLRNYTPPAELFSRFGVDAVRYFLLGSTQIGEDYLFSEEAVQHAFRQTVQLLWNVTEFYQLYARDIGPARTTEDLFQASAHCLDQWILARLADTTAEVTMAMDRFELTRGARPLAPLIDDLSTWYLRRSRDRLKAGESVEVLQHVLRSLGILMAPFTPFIAEQVYAAAGGTRDSVHLEDWVTPPAAPAAELRRSGEADPMTVVLGQMAQVRELAEAIHALRSQANIKLRQPLAAVAIAGVTLPAEYRAVLAEEVNVQAVLPRRTSGGEWLQSQLPQGVTVALRTDLTDELRAAGLVREFIRQVNNLRKEKGLSAGDRVTLAVQASDELRLILEAALPQIVAATSADRVEWGEVAEGASIEVGESTAKVALRS